jgi:hypothetical protein
MKSKIEKLESQAHSELALGNKSTAKLYFAKANELKEKAQKARTKQKVNESWRCSCGFSISISIIDVGAMGRTIADEMLKPHRIPGHQLKQI